MSKTKYGDFPGKTSITEHSLPKITDHPSFWGNKDTTSKIFGHVRPAKILIRIILSIGHGVKLSKASRIESLLFARHGVGLSVIPLICV